MRNKSTTPTAQHELPTNIVGFLTSPSVQVDPIQEIQTLYAVDQWYAIDIYERVGEDYTDPRIVAALCSITKEGGRSC